MQDIITLPTEMNKTLAYRVLGIEGSAITPLANDGRLPYTLRIDPQGNVYKSFKTRDLINAFGVDATGYRIEGE